MGQAAEMALVERRSRVHVEVWAHGGKLHILKRNTEVTEENEGDASVR